jgi:hypothetical protein
MYRLTRRRSQSPAGITRLAGLRVAVPPHRGSHCRCSRGPLRRARDQEGRSPGIPSERIETRWEDRTSLGRVVVEGHGEADGHGRGCDWGGFVRLRRASTQELSRRGAVALRSYRRRDRYSRPGRSRYANSLLLVTATPELPLCSERCRPLENTGTDLTRLHNKCRCWL